MFEDIAQRYMAIYKDCTKEQIMDLLNKYPGRVICNEHLVIMFVRISEETLNKIINNPRIMGDFEFVNKCYQERGEYIYGLKCFGNARLGLKDLIKRLVRGWHPEGIVYHIDRDGFRRLHTAYKRRILCHS